LYKVKCNWFRFKFSSDENPSPLGRVFLLIPLK
jgi:hypothetical protein